MKDLFNSVSGIVCSSRKQQGMLKGKKTKRDTFSSFFQLLKIISLDEASRPLCPILFASVWSLFEPWWQPHHLVATSSTVSPCASRTKDRLFFPSKPGACPCHQCPLLAILWGIMNSHYIKFNGPLPCLLSITPFHRKRVISICSRSVQQIASRLVAQIAWPQASHPVCWGTIHHAGG